MAENNKQFIPEFELATCGFGILLSLKLTKAVKNAESCKTCRLLLSPKFNDPICDDTAVLLTATDVVSGVMLKLLLLAVQLLELLQTVDMVTAAARK